MPATSVYPAREVLGNDELAPQSSVVEASLPGAERTRGVDEDYLCAPRDLPSLCRPSTQLELTRPPSLDLDRARYELKTKAVLPTHEQIGTKLASDVDAQAAAESWLATFARAAETSDASAFTSSFASFGHWRDRVAFTWSFRTFNETEAILQAAQDTVGSAEAHSFKLIEPKPALQTPYPDLSYIQAHFECQSCPPSSPLFAHCSGADTPVLRVPFAPPPVKTTLVRATGIVNLIPTASGSYEAWTLTTAAEELLQFPELEQADGHVMGATSWEKLRRQELEFETEQPEVVVSECSLFAPAHSLAVGVALLTPPFSFRSSPSSSRCRAQRSVVGRPPAGPRRQGPRRRPRAAHRRQLAPAVRGAQPALSALGRPPGLHAVPAQLAGASSLCPRQSRPEPLADAFLPLLRQVYCPAAKLGNWLENYVEALDLKVWTSTTIEEATNNDKDWTLRVVRGGEERILKPKHGPPPSSCAPSPATRLLVLTRLCLAPFASRVRDLALWRGHAAPDQGHEHVRGRHQALDRPHELGRVRRQEGARRRHVVLRL